jgi:hypothetical protein
MERNWELEECRGDEEQRWLKTSRGRRGGCLEFEGGEDSLACCYPKEDKNVDND